MFSKVCFGFGLLLAVVLPLLTHAFMPKMQVDVSSKEYVAPSTIEIYKEMASSAISINAIIEYLSAVALFALAGVSLLRKRHFLCVVALLFALLQLYLGMTTQGTPLSLDFSAYKTLATMGQVIEAGFAFSLMLMAIGFLRPAPSDRAKEDHPLIVLASLAGIAGVVWVVYRYASTKSIALGSYPLWAFLTLSFYAVGFSCYFVAWKKQQNPLSKGILLAFAIWVIASIYLLISKVPFSGFYIGAQSLTVIGSVVLFTTLLIQREKEPSDGISTPQDAPSFDVNAMLAQLVAPYKSRASLQAVRFEIQIPQEKILAYGDRLAIMSLLKQWLERAFHVTLDGRIRIVCFTQASEVLIEVIDEGGCANPQEIEQIYSVGNHQKILVTTTGNGVAISLVLAKSEGVASK